MLLFFINFLKKIDRRLIIFFQSEINTLGDCRISREEVAVRLLRIFEVLSFVWIGVLFIQAGKQDGLKLIFLFYLLAIMAPLFVMVRFYTSMIRMNDNDENFFANLAIVNVKDYLIPQQKRRLTFLVMLLVAGPISLLASLELHDINPVMTFFLFVITTGYEYILCTSRRSTVHA